MSLQNLDLRNRRSCSKCLSDNGSVISSWIPSKIVIFCSFLKSLTACPNLLKFVWSNCEVDSISWIQFLLFLKALSCRLILIVSATGGFPGLGSICELSLFNLVSSSVSSFFGGLLFYVACSSYRSVMYSMQLKYFCFPFCLMEVILSCRMLNAAERRIFVRIINL